MAAVAEFVQGEIYSLYLKHAKASRSGVRLELSFPENRQLSIDRFTVDGFAFQQAWVGDPTKVGMKIDCRAVGVVPGCPAATTFVQDSAFLNHLCYDGQVGKELELRVWRLPREAGGPVKLMDDTTGLLHVSPAGKTGYSPAELSEDMSVRLRLERITEDGDLWFGAVRQTPAKGHPAVASSAPMLIAGGKMPPEGVRCEYKSSIAYVAGKSRLDIRQQLGFVIMREIVSFMNTEGGVLGLGFRDDGSVCGLNRDMLYLNDYYRGTKRGNTYDCSTDALQRLIVDVARENILGPAITAGNLAVDAYAAKLPDGSVDHACIVKVRATAEPAFLRLPSAEGYPGGYAYYHRVNSECCKANPDQMMSIFTERLRRSRGLVPAPAPAAPAPAPAGLTPMTREQAVRPIQVVRPVTVDALKATRESAFAEVFRPLDEKENRRKALFFLDGAVVFGTLKTLRTEGFGPEDVVLTVRTAYRNDVNRLFLVLPDHASYRVLDLRKLGGKAFSRTRARVPGPPKEDLAYPLLAGDKDWLIELCEDNGSYVYRTIRVSSLGSPSETTVNMTPVAKGLYAQAARSASAVFHYAVAPEINYGLAAYEGTKFTALSKAEAEEPDSILRFFRQNFVAEETDREGDARNGEQ